MLKFSAVQFCDSSPLADTKTLTEEPVLSSNKTLPPLIFPDTTADYKIVSGNDTALKILQDAEKVKYNA